MKAYSEGMQAFLEGKNRLHNPYAHGSWQWQDWLAGWRNAAERMEG